MVCPNRGFRTEPSLLKVPERSGGASVKLRKNKSGRKSRSTITSTSVLGHFSKGGEKRRGAQLLYDTLHVGCGVRIVDLGADCGFG